MSATNKHKDEDKKNVVRPGTDRKQWMTDISNIVNRYKEQKQQVIEDIEIYVKEMCSKSTNIKLKEKPLRSVSDDDRKQIINLLSDQLSGDDVSLTDVWLKFKDAILDRRHDDHPPPVKDDQIPEMIHEKGVTYRVQGRKKSAHEEQIKLAQDDVSKELQKTIADLEKRLSESQRDNKTLTDTNDKLNRELGHRVKREEEHEAQNKQLQAQLSESQRDNKTLTDTNDKLNRELDHRVKREEAHVAQNKQLQAQFENTYKKYNNLKVNYNNIAQDHQHSKQSNDRLKENMKELRTKVHCLEEEKNSLLSRLSAIAGAKLNDNNPNITDLGDMNRPQKLADKYSELYDNEWTDVFESLTDNDAMPAESAISQLLNTFESCFEFCQKHARLQYEELLSKATTMDGSEERTKKTESRDKKDPQRQIITQKIVELQKNCANSIIPAIQEKYKSLPDEKSLCHKSDPTVTLYVDKAIEVSWIAGIQSPQLHVEFDIEPYSKVNTDIMKGYTQTGKYIEYMVWPALLLHKNGALLSKGVFQCTNETKASADKRKEELKVICKEKTDRPRLVTSSEDKDGNTSNGGKNTEKANVIGQGETDRARRASSSEDKEGKTSNGGKNTEKANVIGQGKTDRTRRASSSEDKDGKASNGGKNTEKANVIGQGETDSEEPASSSEDKDGKARNCKGVKETYL